MTRHQLHMHLRRHHTHDPDRHLACNPSDWRSWLAGLTNQEMRDEHTRAHAHDLVTTGIQHWHAA